MTLLYWLSAAVSLALIGYLIYALLTAEEF
jgi:K+-transporting ATPase KdpF subunit